MTQKATITATIKRLETAIASGALPDSAGKMAKQLIEKLERPIRIAILGLPGSGKNKLLNFLAGEVVIPDGIDLPSLQLSGSQVLKVDCTLPDGTVKSFNTQDMSELSKLQPIFLQLEMPLQPLESISLLKVVMGPSEKEQKRALAWAAKRTDIALWCTQNFTGAESDLWDIIPEALQDHSFMVATKAASSPKAHGEFLHDAADRFRNVFLVDDLQVNAKKSDTDDGKDLRDAIWRDVEVGNRAMLDSAFIMLSKYGIEDIGSDTPVKEAPPPKPEGTPPPKPEVTADTPPEPKQEPKPEPKEPSAERGLYNDVISHITKQASDLQNRLGDLGKDTEETVLAQCKDSAEWITKQLIARESDDPYLANVLNTCEDAVDLILLMELEKQNSAAEEAVTMLLQVKREFEVLTSI